MLSLLDEEDAEIAAAKRALARAPEAREEAKEAEQPRKQQPQFSVAFASMMSAGAPTVSPSQSLAPDAFVTDKLVKEQRANVEISDYLRAPSLKFDASSDEVLDFWRNNSKAGNFKHVCAAFRKYGAMQATSAGLFERERDRERNINNVLSFLVFFDHFSTRFGKDLLWRGGHFYSTANTIRE